MVNKQLKKSINIVMEWMLCLGKRRLCVLKLCKLYELRIFTYWSSSSSNNKYYV